MRVALEGKIKKDEAAALGLSKQSLNNIIQCHQRPTIDQVDDIRRRFRIPLAAWRRPEK